MVLLSLSSQSNNISQINFNTGDFTVDYKDPILLDKRDYVHYEIGLVSCTIWYTYFNIDTDLNNNVLKYSHNNGVDWFDVVFPDGVYRIESLNSYLQQVISNNGHQPNKLRILANYSALKVQIYIEIGSGFQIDFRNSVSDINDFLGFESGIITAGGYTTATNSANITNDINDLKIKCSLVDSEYSYDNAEKSEIIFTVTPQEQPGSIIVRNPNYIIWVPINTKIIRRIRMYVTDNRGNPIDFNNEHCSYTLYLKKIISQ